MNEKDFVILPARSRAQARLPSHSNNTMGNLMSLAVFNDDAKWATRSIVVLKRKSKIDEGELARSANVILPEWTDDVDALAGQPMMVIGRNVDRQGGVSFRVVTVATLGGGDVSLRECWLKSGKLSDPERMKTLTATYDATKQRMIEKAEKERIK